MFRINTQINKTSGQINYKTFPWVINRMIAKDGLSNNLVEINMKIILINIYAENFNFLIFFNFFILAQNQEKKTVRTIKVILL